MSRAFVKEGDGALDPLPDLPLSPHPNYVTPRGLAQLQSRLAARRADLSALKARADRLDRLPEAAGERDIRYLEARLRSAILVPPAADISEMAFGLTANVQDDQGRHASYTIVGEDEADAAQNLIAPHAPLARALIGARVGDASVNPPT
jgi:transcription elongation factor GreB